MKPTVTTSTSAGSATARIRVALVEDQRGLREALQEGLSHAEGIEFVAACANAEQALTVLPSAEPQIVFMDINLPGMDGVACVRELSAIAPQMLFVMLTVYDNTEAVFNSLKAGACGYLQKPVTPADLTAAAREVMAGGSPMSAKIARLVVQAFKHPAPVSTPSHADVELTTRERGVLDLVFAGFPYKEIADKLQVSEHTVYFHVRNIYKKLQVRSRSEAMARLRKT